jgi:integrase
MAQLLDETSQEAELKPSDFVFIKPTGEPIDPNTVTHNFLKTVRKAGFSELRLHDLRHLHATLLLQADVNPKVVSERLGHANIGITLDIYSHVLPGMQ